MLKNTNLKLTCELFLNIRTFYRASQNHYRERSQASGSIFISISSCEGAFTGFGHRVSMINSHVSLEWSVLHQTTVIDAFKCSEVKQQEAQSTVP